MAAAAAVAAAERRGTGRGRYVCVVVVPRATYIIYLHAFCPVRRARRDVVTVRTTLVREQNNASPISRRFANGVRGVGGGTGAKFRLRWGGWGLRATGAEGTGENRRPRALKTFYDDDDRVCVMVRRTTTRLLENQSLRNKRFCSFSRGARPSAGGGDGLKPSPTYESGSRKHVPPVRRGGRPEAESC